MAIKKIPFDKLEPLIEQYLSTEEHEKTAL